MIKPNFIFTKYYNHFNVYVKNLENLSVEQIQEIEDFVEKRYGFFNFETYSFQVQKRLDFDDFVTLMKISGFEADFKEKFLKKKVKERIGFGQYKGVFYEELPDSYLLWLKSSYRGFDRDKLYAELKRRKL